MSYVGNHHQVTYLLDKMSSPDKDFRFMATNDLMNDLQNNSITLDDTSERNIIKSILKLLDDKNGEVQNLAVKCLAPLVNRLKDPNVDIIVDSLLTNMENEQNGKEQLRDISSMGLKNIIPELEKSHPVFGSSLTRKIITRLTALCSTSNNTGILLESLDIIADALALFGANICSVHKNLLWDCLYPQLQHDRMAVRKKAINAICNLVVHCAVELFFELFEILLNSCANENRSKVSLICTNVQCISGITRRAGHRLNEVVIKSVVPVMMDLISIDNSEEGSDMKESCLQTFEALIRRCPRECEAYSEIIISTALKYLCYDPNYNYDNDDDEAMTSDCGDNDEFEDDDDDEFNDLSDDDDVSWKVRRASAKVLEALMASKPHTAVQFYNKNRASLLVSRFKEREESVKDDIFQAFIVLLRQTKVFIGSSSLSGDSMECTASPASVLQSLVPAILREFRKMFKSPSMKTRQGVFMVLNDLVITLPGCLSDHFSTVVPGIEKCFEEKAGTANLKLDCLMFVSSALKTHHKEVFYPHLPKLVGPIIKGANDKFYRISADSLAVLQLVVQILRPIDDREVHAANYELFLQVFETVYSKLKAVDLDQVVKENAIGCIAQILYNGGDSLNSNFQACLKILVERLNNEITRLYAVRAFTQIASSPREMAFQYEANQAVPLLINFLKKNHRVLRLSSVECLLALVQRHDTAIKAEHYALLVETIPIVLNENDLQITQIACNLLQLVVHNNPSLAPKVFKVVFPSVLDLLRSPVLQGSPLDAMLNFIQSLSHPGQIPFEHLYKPLHGFMFSQAEVLHKQSYGAVAQAVALLSVSASKHYNIVVEYSKFLEQPRGDTPDASKIFCLNTIGEIGKRVDLSQNTTLPSLILSAFDSSNEEMKNAASLALGGITVSSIQSFLPFILNKLKNQQKSRNQYLLLKSLKEFIVVLLQTNVDALRPLDAELWTNLMNYSDCAEEGTRNIVAECLGKLTLLNYSAHLKDLKQVSATQNPLVASTIVTAVKFAITDKPHEIDEHLKPLMGQFLSCLSNEDVNLRRLTLVMLNSAAHNKPVLIRSQLNDILALLYKQTLEDKSLIKLVEMGPFKHEYDLGLDLRKTAFECMYTLLETCLDKIADIFEYLTYLQNGLKDHYDIKMLAHLMLIKLSVLVPGAVMQRLDKIMEAIKLTITTKVKNDSVKQEYDKQEEIKKSALRTVYALMKVPEADRNPAISDVIAMCRTNYPELYSYFEMLRKEGSSSFSGVSALNGRVSSTFELMDTS